MCIIAVFLICILNVSNISMNLWNCNLHNVAILLTSATIIIFTVHEEMLVNTINTAAKIVCALIKAIL